MKALIFLLLFTSFGSCGMIYPVATWYRTNVTNLSVKWGPWDSFNGVWGNPEISIEVREHAYTADISEYWAWVEAPTRSPSAKGFYPEKTIDSLDTLLVPEHGGGIMHPYVYSTFKGTSNIWLMLKSRDKWEDTQWSDNNLILSFKAFSSWDTLDTMLYFPVPKDPEIVKISYKPQAKKRTWSKGITYFDILGRKINKPDYQGVYFIRKQGVFIKRRYR